jgi:hypothetical protein
VPVLLTWIVKGIVRIAAVDTIEGKIERTSNRRNAMVRYSGRISLITKGLPKLQDDALSYHISSAIVAASWVSYNTKWACGKFHVMHVSVKCTPIAIDAQAFGTVVRSQDPQSADFIT